MPKERTFRHLPCSLGFRIRADLLLLIPLFAETLDSKRDLLRPGIGLEAVHRALPLYPAASNTEERLW